LNLPRGELAVRRWLEIVKEAQDTRRSSGTEQQCNVCRQVVAVVDRGEVGRRRCDGGRNEGTMVAEGDSGGDGARPATLASWTEARRWRRAKLCVHEREDGDGFARFGNLNKRYDLSSINTRGIKCYRPRSFSTRGQIICYRPRSFATQGQIICCQCQFINTGGH